jgi:predicted phosphodiesterase
LEKLTTADLQLLTHFPGSQVIELNTEGSIRVVHGSPRLSTEHILPKNDSRQMEPFEDAGLLYSQKVDVKKALKMVSENVLICGHSHIPWQYESVGRLALNPGSVGAPVDGDIRAHYMLLERMKISGSQAKTGRL